MTSDPAPAPSPIDPFEIGIEPVLGEQMEVFVHRPRSLRELLESSRRFRDTEYLVFDDVRLSYAEHADRVAALAAGLRERHGIGVGDRVAILAENRVEWLLSFWATLSLGGVVVGLNGWWAAPEIEYALSDSEPALLLVDDRGRRRLGGVPDAERPFRVVDIVTGTAELVAAQPITMLPTQSIDEDDPAVILYTSGTTGRPKGAVHSHRGVIAMVQLQTLATERRRAALGGLPQDIACTTFPFFHVSGLYGSVVAATIGGDTMVFVTGRFDAERVLATIEREHCTRFSIVPTIAWRVLRHPSVPDRDLRSVTKIAGGAAPTGAALQQRLREVFPNAALGFGYGLTESTAMATGASDDDLRDDPDTAGRPVPTVQLQIRAADGLVLPDGEQGEIHLRGPVVMPGYWRNPAATAAVIGPGRWLRTGDIGRLTNGRLTLSARRSDLILRGGENVYPAEIELCLDAHPDIAESAVFGVPDPEWGEAVLAVVVAAGPDELDIDALTGYLEQRLAKFKVPTKWQIRTSGLPRTATGKVMKRRLTEQQPEDGADVGPAHR
ncbi:class I adenylate-forming enzyme family protein [Nakamurella lactea]|uniref:class I adenylate-forming enzyme family protein n=1 Tax=Nakamurella lactea TaxID=459515 RepID=UPI00040DE1C6|nr:class I adenylate-forming enzyme family protein [Nakamurella lactea]